MSFCFLGVDVGGEENTWAVAVEREGLRPLPVLSLSGARPVGLEEITEFVRKERVLAVALDAPLSFSLKDRRGFREADTALRESLAREGGQPGWVLSYHALQAAPVRGLLLAEALSPFVGTILETHPRAGLYFTFPGLREAVRLYKDPRSPAEERAKAVLSLWRALVPADPPVPPTDGLVDALSCALSAAAYHLCPQTLLFLPGAPTARGFGPFVVLRRKIPSRFFTGSR
ncbi:DUF429 domain-containing protein [Thermosulfurimonas sp. F29]|uniref:DUF429 domain-containing protein n=1 Tax=Thermosulfurimonas sp. F29 TaxID=2867247 RepID=UPI001C83941D|nr:DUF429 domain-containing protein [Thermosulfurimonas sp. F29]MBX6422126.1 DUF429 domain-containing protein [Thermosulfurimonas sp. F29]